VAGAILCGMINPHRRPGVTLLELLFALVVVAVLIGIAYPAFHGMLDRIAVRAARDALVVGVARTRVVAAGAGGAYLVLESPAARFGVENAAGDTLVAFFDLGNRYGVELSIDGITASRLRLRYDGLGLGRLASRTIRVNRGSQEAGLFISAYGRARPW